MGDVNQTFFINIADIITLVNYVYNDHEITQEQQLLLGTIESWKRYWESNDTDDYLSFYSKNFLTEKWNSKSWSEHKRIVNTQNKRRRILIDDLSILKRKNIYLIT